MKSSKTFNNISDRLKAEIPKLEKGKTVVFQMLHGVPNPEPDERERSKSPILFGKKQVLTNFRIYDPYQKDSDGKEVGGYVDIGVVDSWDGDKPVRFRTFVPGQGEYAQFQGKFQLTGGNIKDEELYEILWLSNEREGNPHRDTSTELSFKILDAKSDSRAAVTKVDRLLDAINAAKTMTLEEAAGIMASLNQPSYQDDGVLRAKVLEFAKNNVDEFLNTVKSPDNKTNLTIRKAIDAGIISHDIASGDVNMGKVNLTNIKALTVNDFIPLFTQWVKSSQNGKDVLSNIESQLNKKATTA
jgi:hypothetical protein